MENTNRIFKDILYKLQDCLEDFKCKSEVKLSEKEGILYGKFSLENERYTVVVHLKEEDFKPITSGGGRIEGKEENIQKHFMPSLDLQVLHTDKSNCSEDEQLEIKNKFIEEANQVGREFIKKAKR